ncbi:MAG: hypothetical protein ACXAEU_10230 [Candidatus Hodarchaeales archaeon]
MSTGTLIVECHDTSHGTVAIRSFTRELVNSLFTSNVDKRRAEQCFFRILDFIDDLPGIINEELTTAIRRKARASLNKMKNRLPLHKGCNFHKSGFCFLSNKVNAPCKFACENLALSWVGVSTVIMTCSNCFENNYFIKPTLNLSGKELFEILLSCCGKEIKTSVQKTVKNIEQLNNFLNRVLKTGKDDSFVIDIYGKYLTYLAKRELCKKVARNTSEAKNIHFVLEYGELMNQPLIDLKTAMLLG